MPDVAPFRAIRYDPAAVGDLGSVVAPPYDVIPEAERDALERASPYNVVRLVLPRDEPSDDEDRYTRARALVRSWLAAGALREDPAETLSLYEERFSLGGEARVQRGVIAAVSLEEAGGVLPHERTYPAVVEDRLRLLRATEANLDFILCVYEGDAAAHEAIEAAARPDPLARFPTPDGLEHAVWTIAEARAVEGIRRALSTADVVIADGHHRWRTALAYRDERRASEGPGPWDRMLMYLVDASRWGPAILPIHRVLAGVDPARALERLAEAYAVEEAATADPEALATDLARRRGEGRAFVLHDGVRAWWLRSRDPAAERAALPAERSEAWRDLDVAVLHGFVLDGLLRAEAGFAHSATDAVEAVRARRASLAFLLAPTTFEAVRAVAGAGEAMPPKSTYFVPKPKTGVAMRALGP